MAFARMRGKGQITLPSEIRKAARLEEGDPVEVELVEGGVLLRPKKVIDSTQAWFWTPEWQRREAEADAEMTSGRGAVYTSDEEFLAALHE